jgi:hypothetical protein
MCGKKMLVETPTDQLRDRLAQRRAQLGKLIAKRRDAVFMSDFYGASLHGTITRFQFNCEYENGRSREELKVFEPSDGGIPEVHSYRFEGP